MAAGVMSSRGSGSRFQQGLLGPEGLETGARADARRGAIPQSFGIPQSLGFANFLGWLVELVFLGECGYNKD